MIELDDLRTRIAAVIAASINRSDIPPPEQISGCGDPECCDPVYDYDIEDVARNAADAVIRELGLKREETLHSVLPDYDRNTVRANVWAHRYVTKWETSE